MCMRVFIDNAKCIVNESYGYSPRMQPRVHKTECANFFRVCIANVGTFCATLVEMEGRLVTRIASGKFGRIASIVLSWRI